MGDAAAAGAANPFAGLNLSEDAGPRMNVIVWFTVGVSALFAALRVYCKFLRSTRLWWDDYSLLGAWLMLLVFAILNSVSIHLGFGKHLPAINPANLSEIGLIGNIAATFSIVAVIWSKMSFGLTLLRITDGKVKALVWFIIITINAALGVSAAVTWIQCTPISKSWNRLETGTCWDGSVTVGYGIFSGIYSGVMDIVLALLPWTVIWNLQMKTKEKIGVAVAMSMGVFAGCTAFIKTSKVPVLAEGDFTFEGWHLVAWGSAETGSAIVAASIPALRVLVKEAKATMTRKYGYGTGSTHGTRHEKDYDLSSRSGSKTTTVVISSVKPPKGSGTGHRAKRSSVMSDDRSDKSFLDLGPEATSGRILQTQEIAIEYHAREDGYEMKDMI